MGGLLIPPAVNIEGLTKTFPGQRVLDGIRMSVEPGEVHGLLGENGSGKSTLIKILSGYYEPDPGGSVEVYGRPLQFGSPLRSDSLGLRFVHQHLGIIDEFSAVENLALSSSDVARPLRRVNLAEQTARVQELVARLGIDVDVRRPLGECRAIDRTVIAIVRALDGLDEQHGVLVLDEPTAALPPHEVECLFAVIRELARTGVTTIYVSHRLDEIFELCDRVSVLRDGQMQPSVAIDEINRSGLIEMILGHDVDGATTVDRTAEVRTSDRGSTQPLMRVEGLRAGVLRGISLDVHAGEVVGVAGLLGSGREELSSAVVGAIPACADAVWMNGARVARSMTPARARSLGIGMIPGDRQAQSVVADFSLRENVTLANLSPLRRGGRLSRATERRVTSHWIEQLDVRPSDPEKRFSLLSGGNQQKAILGRWFNIEPSLMLIDEPTAGVDIGARQAIYDHIRSQAAGGVGFVVCSSDHEDLVKLCSRVIVLANGEQLTELSGDEITLEGLLHATMGEAA